jgi:hypothetical protein
MFTEKEKEVLKSIVEYHLKELKENKKITNEDFAALAGAEEQYEAVLREILNKLK